MTLEFHETPLAGAFVISQISHDDECGSFGRLFYEDEAGARG